MSVSSFLPTTLFGLSGRVGGLICALVVLMLVSSLLKCFSWLLRFVLCSFPEKGGVLSLLSCRLLDVTPQRA